MPLNEPPATESIRRLTDTGPVLGPNTTELAAVRGRRAARPQTSRRRLELVLGRSLSNRRIWGAALAVGFVLAVPAAATVPSAVTIADAGLSGRNTESPARLPDAVSSSVSDQTLTELARDRARDKAKVSALAVATSAGKAMADAAEAAEKAAKNTSAAESPGTRTPSSGSTGRLNSSLSGLGWPSGVFSRGQGVSGAKSFGDWRGAGVDVIVDWGARQSWDDVINPDWLYRTWKNTPYTKVFGIAPVPEGDGSATMASCAAGSYNDKWRQFGSNIQSAGLADETVIRLGWEFNGDWYKWQATDPKQFAECWRQIVSSAEQTAPGLLWDWTVNRGKGASVVDARAAYPGDDYVDIVGVDSYDMWPGVRTAADWAEHYSGAYGLKFWADFARSHGKKLSVPEWGVYPGNSASNGGDNAFYVSKMRDFFQSQGSRLAYEAYFNESADYIGAALFSPTQNPSAASKYRALFRN